MGSRRFSKYTMSYMVMKYHTIEWLNELVTLWKTFSSWLLMFQCSRNVELTDTFAGEVVVHQELYCLGITCHSFRKLGEMPQAQITLVNTSH